VYPPLLSSRKEDYGDSHPAVAVEQRKGKGGKKGRRRRSPAFLRFGPPVRKRSGEKEEPVLS